MRDKQTGVNISFIRRRWKLIT